MPELDLKYHQFFLVLAMSPNSRVGSGSASTRNRTVAMGFTTRKTRTVAFGPVSTGKPRPGKPGIFPPMKYLSSDRITTWSVRRLSSFSRSFTSNIQICDRTNICWVAIKNPQISTKIVRFSKATQRILVGSPTWKREVKERLILYNLQIDHVMIRSQFIYLIGANVAGTVIWNRSPGTTRPKNRGFMSGPGNNPAKTKQFGFLARSGTKPNRTAGQNPDHWRVTRTRC